ncbi:unnamed protein product [Pieris macdunnoughi]|uniref:Reverse transcriptase n=1 Tax=Pieris macdunnoughi TaxID=345717 RepID=A0A821U0Q2_9NEOP|nr:unnamed protein product [Pieris macdunnoughi]
MKTKHKGKEDTITTNRLSIAKVATDFYKNLYTETDRTTPEEEEKEAYEAEVIPCILESEVTQAIKSQKSGKAPGDDKISKELLKQGLPAITKYVTLLFNEIIETEPIQWTKSTIILLHKKTLARMWGRERFQESSQSDVLMAFVKNCFPFCETW